MEGSLSVYFNLREVDAFKGLSPSFMSHKTYKFIFERNVLMMVKIDMNIESYFYCATVRKQLNAVLTAGTKKKVARIANLGIGFLNKLLV